MCPSRCPISVPQLGACPTSANINSSKYFIISMKKYIALLKHRDMFMSGHSPMLPLQNVSKQHSMRLVLIELRLFFFF